MSATVNAVILKIPREDTDGMTICAGLLNPVMKGPINNASVNDRMRPIAILAESKLGITSTLARPCPP